MSPTLDAICHGEARTIDGERIYVVSVRLTASEMDAVLLTFDEASATSPSAAECRALARPVVKAVRDALGGG